MAKQLVRWVNFYPPCANDRLSAGNHPWRTTSWNTREDADKNAMPNRWACIRVEFDNGDGINGL